MDQITPLHRAQGCLLGLAVGDAVGTTLEFRRRGTFEPIDDMIGGGPFGLAAGQWTDDTSMALCLAHSLLHRGGFDARDQMNRYCNWRDHGYLSSTGSCFDIGNTVNAALTRFLRNADPWAGSTDPATAGNGSIMRLAPVVLFYAPDRIRAIELSAASSRTTHGAPEAVQGCEILAHLLLRALDGAPKAQVLEAVAIEATTPAMAALATGAWRGKTAREIRGSGYVVESLEAALWCFANTDSFRDCILAAANLGDDADTTAAVAGQIAGAHYGAGSIPPTWRARLHEGDEIARLAARLHDAVAADD